MAALPNGITYPDTKIQMNKITKLSESVNGYRIVPSAEQILPNI